jgi:competence protein ComEC
MLGIVFGIKEEMNPEFYLDLQKVGLVHVIAASGMNITMLGGFLSLFFALFLKRQLAIIMTVLGIIFYAVLAGLEPSIVRAAIMGILVFLAQLTGRQNSSFLALFFAGFVMLMRSPFLILDIGFQLSFLATLGLIYLRPLFGLISSVKRLEKNVFIEDLTTTLSAQIMTLPILLVNFGTYSLWSIPANAIVLWTVPFLMIIGGISAVIAFIFEPLGRLILYLSMPFLLYFTKIVEVFGGFGGQIEIKSLPIILILGYYLAILALIIHFRKHE